MGGESSVSSRPPIGDLAPLEALVWGWLFLPGKRPFAAFAKASGPVKLTAAAKVHGISFEIMLDADKSEQKAMKNASRR